MRLKLICLSQKAEDKWFFRYFHQRNRKENLVKYLERNQQEQFLETNQ